MIITCKKDIPFRWILFCVLPWSSFGYMWGVTGVAVLFSLKKFVENPAGLTFILSLPTFVSIVVGPCANFMSDRIWTRIGRRKPFVIVSWIGITTTLFLMPLMPNFWALLGVYMLYSFFTDLNAPLEPLQQEVIPPHERGRATGTMYWFTNFAGIIFYFVALGRFDDVQFMAGVPVTGEEIIYWSAGLLLTVMLLLVALGIREIDPESGLLKQPFSFKNLVGGLFDPELWPVYLLVFGSASLAAGLGPLGNLLYTDQWNYTKQDMGINVAVGGVLNMFIIGFLTAFADKLSRMRAYRTLLCLSVALNLVYFCYVTFVLPDQRPSLIEIIVFGETSAIVGLLTLMVYVPLVYDYIRRNKMGTYAAGATIIQRATGLITLNGVGLFIWAYALFFQPPVGEMVRIVLNDRNSNRADVISQIKAAPWANTPATTTIQPSSIDAFTWQADGTVAATGRCWEVRVRDASSEMMADQKEALLRESSRLETQAKLLNDQAHSVSLKQSPTAAATAERNSQTMQMRINAITARVHEIDSTLDGRAKEFEQEITSSLGGRILKDGDQVTGAVVNPALLVEFALTKRPDTHRVETMFGELKRASPGIIDLRPLKRDNGYSLVASLLLADGKNVSRESAQLQRTVETIVNQADPGLLEISGSARSDEVLPAITLHLMTVEEPLKTYVSPIHRVVNLVLGIFDAVPSSTRQLAAIVRDLRAPDGINHIRLEPDTHPKSVVITAVLPDSAPKAVETGDAISLRLQNLMNASGHSVSVVRAFYDRIEEATANQRLTIARPILASGYGPMKYNYMIGYLWMVLLGSMSVAITFLFTLLEAKGYIQKHGVMEAEAP